MNKMNYTQDQLNALDLMRKFINNPNKNSFILSGAGGVGKTTVINEITKEQYLRGNRVIVGAFSNKATNVIGKKNPYASKMTLHKLLSLKADESTETLQFSIPFNEKNDSNIYHNDLIIIDEISQCPDDLFNVLIKEIEKYNKKLICIGDRFQLPPVSQKSDSIAFDIEDNYELREIVRQSSNSDIPIYASVFRDIIEEIKNGSKIPIISKIEYDESNDIRFYNDSKPFLDLIVKDFTSDEYKKNNDYVKVIGYRNNTIDKVNELIRRSYFNGITEPLMVGDRMVLNSPGYSCIDNICVMDTSDEFQILEIISREIYEKEHYGVKIAFPYCRVLVQRCDDKQIGDLFIVYPAFKEKFEEMVKQWAKNIKGQKDIFRYEWYPFIKKFNTPSYSYAMTTHKMQGSTVNKIYVLEDDIDQVKKSDVLTLFKSKYVAVSRPSEKLYLLNRIKNRPIYRKD